MLVVRLHRSNRLKSEARSPKPGKPLARVSSRTQIKDSEAVASF